MGIHAGLWYGIVDTDSVCVAPCVGIVVGVCLLNCVYMGVCPYSSMYSVMHGCDPTAWVTGHVSVMEVCLFFNVCVSSMCVVWGLCLHSVLFVSPSKPLPLNFLF